MLIQNVKCRSTFKWCQKTREKIYNTGRSANKREVIPNVQPSQGRALRRHISAAVSTALCEADHELYPLGFDKAKNEFDDRSTTTTSMNPPRLPILVQVEYGFQGWQKGHKSLIIHRSHLKAHNRVPIHSLRFAKASNMDSNKLETAHGW